MDKLYSCSWQVGKKTQGSWEWLRKLKQEIGRGLQASKMLRVHSAASSEVTYWKTNPIKYILFRCYQQWSSRFIKVTWFITLSVVAHAVLTVVGSYQSIVKLHTVTTARNSCRSTSFTGQGSATSLKLVDLASKTRWLLLFVCFFVWVGQGETSSSDILCPYINMQTGRDPTRAINSVVSDIQNSTQQIRWYQLIALSWKVWPWQVESDLGLQYVLLIIFCAKMRHVALHWCSMKRCMFMKLQ